jgi:hypothetical protein
MRNKHVVLSAFRLLAVLMMLARGGTMRADEGPVRIEEVEYRGWKHNVKLSNGDAELIATLDVGPRIISFRLTGGKNVFKEYEAQIGRAGESEWMIRGGHRLWTAPEDTTRTYALDNSPITYHKLGGGIRLVSPDDKTYGIRKEIDLELAAHGSKASLTHRITNVGSRAVELAPWALSVMAPGGTEIIPLPAKAPHPGSVKNAKAATDFGPNQLWVLWPYTELSDPRWKFDADFIYLTQRASTRPTKIGLLQRPGKAGYLNGKTLFIKSFDFRPGQRYPDGGVNYETFTDGEMLEMESLGPQQTLEPGRSVEHREGWELHENGSGTIDVGVLARLRVQ